MLQENARFRILIKGVQYITEHADEIDVVNISVETPLSPALNRAVSTSIKAGVTYIVAAGNYGHDVGFTSPASTSDVVTVSAIADSDGKCGGIGPSISSNNATDDSFAPFSNFVNVSVLLHLASQFYRLTLMMNTR